MCYADLDWFSLLPSFRFAAFTSLQFTDRITFNIIHLMFCVFEVLHQYLVPKQDLQGKNYRTFGQLQDIKMAISLHQGYTNVLLSEDYVSKEMMWWTDTSMLLIEQTQHLNSHCYCFGVQKLSCWLDVIEYFLFTFGFSLARKCRGHGFFQPDGHFCQITYSLYFFLISMIKYKQNLSS